MAYRKNWHQRASRYRSTNLQHEFGQLEINVFQILPFTSAFAASLQRDVPEKGQLIFSWAKIKTSKLWKCEKQMQITPAGVVK